MMFLYGFYVYVLKTLYEQLHKTFFNNFIEKNSRCCNEKLITSPDEDCCAGVVYNKQHKTCCQFGEDYELFDIRNGGCCMTRAFDKITHKCTFDGRIVENRGG